jgi:hypothetical protein
LADFTITISNNLYPLGPDNVTPSLWGVFQWGQPWLYTANGLITATNKLITNAVTPSSVQVFHVGKLLTNTVTPSDDYQFSSEKVISNSLAPSFETSSEQLANGSWNYVFRKPSSNAEDRNLATFTTSTNASTTWTSQPVGSSNWS